MNKSVRRSGTEWSTCAQCAIKWVIFDSFWWVTQINLSQDFPSQSGLLGMAVNHIWIPTPHQSYMTEVMKPVQSCFLPVRSSLLLIVFVSGILCPLFFNFKSPEPFFTSFFFYQPIQNQCSSLETDDRTETAEAFHFLAVVAGCAAFKSLCKLSSPTHWLLYEI